MKITRLTITTRCLTGRCPNCGRFGIFKNWFRLHKHCAGCDMELEKEESGFYFGTTSIGYVLTVLLVALPVCALVALDRISMWWGVLWGLVGTGLVCVLLYPPMLCAVLAFHFTLFAKELPANQEKDGPTSKSPGDLSKKDDPAHQGAAPRPDSR